MNSKHTKTLVLIFSHPVPKQLRWRDIEALLCALGAPFVEGKGSRVRFKFDGMIVTCHRPHPVKVAKPYQVRDIRAFLEKLGVSV